MITLVLVAVAFAVGYGFGIWAEQRRAHRAEIERRIWS